MNKLYINPSGNVCIDDNQNIVPFSSTREGIKRIWLLKEDTQILYNSGKDNTTETRMCTAGDIVIEFYETTFPNKLIVIDSKEWKENLESYEAEEQRIKEAWALKNKENEEKKCEDCGCNC